MYAKITLIKNFSPFNTVSRFNVSIHTLYNSRSLKRDNTFGFEQNFVQKFGFKTKLFPEPMGFVCVKEHFLKEGFAFIYAFSRHFYPRRLTIAIQVIHVLGEIY